MTVSELIAELQKMPQDSEVMIPGYASPLLSIDETASIAAYGGIVVLTHTRAKETSDNALRPENR